MFYLFIMLAATHVDTFSLLPAERLVLAGDGDYLLCKLNWPIQPDQATNQVGSAQACKRIWFCFRKTNKTGEHTDCHLFGARITRTIDLQSCEWWWWWLPDKARLILETECIQCREQVFNIQIRPTEH